MPRRSGSPRSLLSRQRAAVRALRSELFGADGTLGHPYFRDLARDLQDVEGKQSGYTIAVDVVDAGVGDTVLILDEGSWPGRYSGWSTVPSGP